MTTTSITFNYTGSYETWNVPTGVSSVAFEVVGGSGFGEVGGKGANVTGMLNTSNITQLFIYVGAGGNTTNRWNGGGKSTNRDGKSSVSVGGDASDIRIGSRMLIDRIVVAGGGGAAGYNTTSMIDINGTFVTETIYNVTGGNGGYPTGQTIGNSGGGTQNSGGINTISSLQNGSFGIGGSNSSSNGGGSGWYGGAGSTGSNLAAGGGSSYTNPSYVSAVTHTSGTNTGNGYVKLTWSLNPRPKYKVRTRQELADAIADNTIRRIEVDGSFSTDTPVSSQNGIKEIYTALPTAVITGTV
jgi:hypothetical protein